MDIEYSGLKKEKGSATIILIEKEYLILLKDIFFLMHFAFKIPVGMQGIEAAFVNYEYIFPFETNSIFCMSAPPFLGLGSVLA